MTTITDYQRNRLQTIAAQGIARSCSDDATLRRLGLIETVRASYESTTVQLTDAGRAALDAD